MPTQGWAVWLTVDVPPLEHQTNSTSHAALKEICSRMWNIEWLHAHTGSDRLRITYPSGLGGPRELSKSSEDTESSMWKAMDRHGYKDTVRNGNLQYNVPTYMEDNGQMWRQG